MKPEEIEKAALEIQSKKDWAYTGNDNYGKPKLDYFKKLVQMTDEELFKEMKSKIWLSAYAGNNPRSDYHFQCDSTWDEGNRRGKPDLYSKAHKEVSKSV